VTNIYDIKENDNDTNSLKPTYWTAYWWSTFNGNLGARLGLRDYIILFHWQEKYQYIKDNPISSFIKRDLVRKLSPSEKYDLLVGDPNLSLTRAMWKKGEDSMNNHGQIFYWDGLCDGLAVASVTLPRPKKAVTLYSKDGRLPIIFYPEDIKALGSLLYANSRPPYRMIGSRCDNRLPQIDENGRFIARECFNVNPGAFHLSLVNQIGLAKRAFVMDSVSSNEVWNYPIVGYKFKYFNPESLEEVEKMENAIIPYADFTKDKFSRYRSKKVAKVIGIQADVTFLKDRRPLFKDVENDKHNEPGLVIYRYDLELDKKGKIIGGEWYHGHHPDFLWVTEKEIKAKGPYDDELRGTWNPEKELIPDSWTTVALKSSTTGEVVAPIVETLFNLSHIGADGINPNQKD
jgi:hypothetical protein